MAGRTIAFRFEKSSDRTFGLNQCIYLFTTKAFRQAGLTGLKGGLTPKVAVGKTRSSLERASNSIRNSLEDPVESQPE
jgi:hypothetical protein